MGQKFSNSEYLEMARMAKNSSKFQKNCIVTQSFGPLRTGTRNFQIFAPCIISSLITFSQPYAKHKYCFPCGFQCLFLELNKGFQRGQFFPTQLFGTKTPKTSLQGQTATLCQNLETVHFLGGALLPAWTSDRIVGYNRLGLVCCSNRGRLQSHQEIIQIISRS